MTEYNGWTNYETWLANLWLTNDEPSYKVVSLTAQEYDDAYDLGKWIERYASAYFGVDDLHGFAADMMNASWQEIDWTEIADSFMEES